MRPGINFRSLFFMEYNHLKIELKWQKYWQENKTFKTEKEFHEFVQGHSLPEERRLLRLGFALGCNFAVHKINKDLDDTKKGAVMRSVLKGQNAK